MEYPIFEVPLLTGGLLIGAVAIVHVFISHFAVGGGLFLVLTEWKAYKEKSAKILDYVKGHSLFFVLITLVTGAVTGVGIWFTIGLVHPMATSTLIHAFVWAWAIEWIFFFVEITAAIIYYLSWDRISRKVHLAIGWIYFVGAWASLAVINGILSFMLTPGAWLETGNFWDGIFNPSYFSSTLIRTAVSITLAGLYGLLTATLIKDSVTRSTLVRYNSKWLLTGFVILPFAGALYMTAIPPLARFISTGGSPAVTLFVAAAIFFSALLALFTWLAPFRNPKTFTTAFAALFMILGFIVTGITEWTREAVRKPYIIYNYMYSNGIRGEDITEFNREGLLAHAKWSPVREITLGNRLEAGRELFRLQCAQCHSLDGYNGVRALVYGWGDVEGHTERQLASLQTLKPFMPPFVGTEEERRALALWLNSLHSEGTEEGMR